MNVFYIPRGTYLGQRFWAIIGLNFTPPPSQARSPGTRKKNVYLC